MITDMRPAAFKDNLSISMYLKFWVM